MTDDPPPADSVWVPQRASASTRRVTKIAFVKKGRNGVPACFIHWETVGASTYRSNVLYHGEWRKWVRESGATLFVPPHAPGVTIADLATKEWRT